MFDVEWTFGLFSLLLLISVPLFDTDSYEAISRVVDAISYSTIDSF